MINNRDSKQNKDKKSNESWKPNEKAGFHFSTSIKITDPNTKEVLLAKRGDQ